tara:strand:+ start:249 stop:458 length:210 start_codon:yes stop_codon:yes gene_type:complete
MNADQAAEQMQTAFSVRGFANVSHVIGSDWACGLNFNSVSDYQQAAYERADSLFGVLPYRYEASFGCED